MRMLGRNANVSSVIFGILFTLLGLLPGMSAATAQAQSLHQTLNQYVADLQKNPNDYALREKIIRHVQAMKQKPAVPDEARKYMDRGIAAIEGAKGEEDFRAASVEFAKAANLAPWLGDAYRNLAIAQDKSGQYDAALKNLRFYLLTSPSPADEAWAKSLINKVEYRKEKAAKESSPAASAAQEQKKFDELLNKMDGRRYRTHTRPGDIYRFVVDVQGKKLVFGRYFMDNPDPWRYPHCNHIPIQGRVFTCSYQDKDLGLVNYTYSISEDGNRITCHIRYQGKEAETVYLWP